MTIINNSFYIFVKQLNNNLKKLIMYELTLLQDQINCLVLTERQFASLPYKAQKSYFNENKISIEQVELYKQSDAFKKHGYASMPWIFILSESVYFGKIHYDVPKLEVFLNEYLNIEPTEYTKTEYTKEQLEELENTYFYNYHIA